MKIITSDLKRIIIVSTVGLLLFGTTGYSENRTNKKEKIAANSQENVETPRFQKELVQVLEKKIELLENFAKDSQLIEMVRVCNDKTRELSISEILKIDEKWQKSQRTDDFIESLLCNECSKHLLDFQEEHDEFPEIFITDKRGLICGETNKTTDYYQADEQWWVSAYNRGKGRSYYGDIEYDKSAMAEAISIYIPVIDPKINKAIGVIKVVYDITAIKMEL